MNVGWPYFWPFPGTQIEKKTMPKKAEKSPLKVLLIGVRFDADAEVRNGVNSIVVEDVPIAGPIWYVTGFEDGESLAECDRCGAQSPLRKRFVRGGAIDQWSHKHRCNFKKQHKE